MNAVIEAIRKRRSVRSYQPRPVPRDAIRAIIEAGNGAPSAMNSQPWRFVVVEDKGAKDCCRLPCPMQNRFSKWRRTLTLKDMK